MAEGADLLQPIAEGSRMRMRSDNSRSTSSIARGTRLTRRQFTLAFVAVASGTVLAGLDQTIVITSLPAIGGDLGSFPNLSWILTSYLITSVVAMPVFGKLSDQFGRRGVYQSAVGLFLLASVLAGSARSFPQLVAFRALQGVGGGALIALSQTIVGDLVSPRERGRIQGYLGTVLAVPILVGPLLGGLLVDHMSWRWIFFLNIPLGMSSLLLSRRALDLPFPRGAREVDIVGALLLIAGMSTLLIAITAGGDQLPWSSPITLACSIGAVVSLGLFVRNERRVSEPIVSPRLVTDRVVAVASAGAFLSNVAVLGSAVFLVLFIQFVVGSSATGSGLLLSPMIIALFGSLLVTGRLVTRTGRYRLYPLLGASLITAGFIVATRLGVGANSASVLPPMVLIGAGSGMITPVMFVAVQSGAVHSDLGIATSLVSLFRQMGGAVGVALFQAILSHRFAASLARYAGGDVRLAPELFSSGAASLGDLTPAAREVVIRSLASGLQDVFLVAAIVGLLLFAVLTLLPEIPLSDVAHVGTVEVFGATEAAHGVGGGEAHNVDGSAAPEIGLGP